MEMTEEQMPASHSPGEGRTFRLFDGTTCTLKACGEGYALVECEAPAGCGPPPHAHSDQHEAVLVLEGEFSFVSEEGARTLGPGGVASFPGGTVHAFKAVGGAPGRCVMLLTPPGGYERFVEEVGAPVSDVSDGASRAWLEGPPGMEKVLESARRNGVELLITPV